MVDKRLHLIIEGKVQGVFYRASAMEKAVSLGLSGFVRNLSGGEVELVAEGRRENLDELISWCRIGPPNANVTDIKSTFSTPIGEFDNFHIQY